MKIGILGSGIVGQTLGPGFVNSGHDVMIGTRSPEKLNEWISKTGDGASAGTFEEAAKFGELIVFCPLFRAAKEIISLAGEDNMNGKIVIDTTNPIAEAPPKDGVLVYTKKDGDSAGEIIQELLPNSHVVKAFNSIGSPYMVNPHFEEGKPTMFICGNNSEAKKTVTDILTEWNWEVADCGPIEASNALEGLCIIWCAIGFRTGKWDNAFKLLKK